MEGLGELIEVELRRRGKTQADLARKSLLGPATISRLLSGERNPRAVTLRAIAEYFGWTYDAGINRIIVGGKAYPPDTAAAPVAVISDDDTVTAAELRKLSRERLRRIQAMVAEAIIELDAGVVGAIGREPPKLKRNAAADLRARGRGDRPNPSDPDRPGR